MSEAFFLPVKLGQRFCLYHAPNEQHPRGAILYVHPFAEEMNKSRRMAALQSRLMAAQGYAVLQMDLYGCGDSSGDFGDATWQHWLQDVLDARAWLGARCDAPFWLWGLRAGCLVVSQAAALLNESVNLILWQPVISGKQYLQQFLRLKVAGELIGGNGKGVMDDLKQRLAAGQSVEIAGYTLSPGMANGLEATELLPPQHNSRAVWLELSARPDATLAPVSAKCLERWQAAGHSIRSAVLSGPSFWQTVEIEEAPALLTATLPALESDAS